MRQVAGLDRRILAVGSEGLCPGTCACRRVFDVAASIVLLVDEEGVVEFAGIFEVFDDASDVTVHAGDLSGVDFHTAFLPFRVLLILPCGHVRIARRKFPIGLDDTERFHLRVALVAEFVPAFGVTALIVLDVFRFGVERPMGGVVGDV